MEKSDHSIDELSAQLRATCGALAEGEISFIPSFWEHRPKDNFPPPTLRSPEEFRGGERISIACTQTELHARAQRELVARWCDALPTFRDLRYVWFHSRTTQSLFEAACTLPRLECLYIKWSGINDLEPLTSAQHLLNLHLGSSPGVRSIDPLSQLKQLIRLDLDNVKVRSLAPIGKLTGLLAHSFTGAKPNTVESFEPLAHLRDLQWLHIGCLKTDDMSLKPLRVLKQLQYLAIGNFFEAEEFARLSVSLPNTLCNWLQPYARSHKSLFPCPKCKQNWRVMTSGKGAKLLCPTCDAERLAKHVLLFERLKAEARASER
jgi:hypothetical protein